MAQTHRSKTQDRQKAFYPTPQNLIRLKKYAFNDDGSKKDGKSMNKTVNEALDMFFKTLPK